MDRNSQDFRSSAAMATSIADHSREQIAASGNRSTTRRTLDIRDGFQARNRDVSQQNRAIQTVTIQSILKGAREAIIDFDGAAYRLRITRNHRLILTK